jgi:amino acid transporter
VQLQAKNPARDMPIGIVGATTVCTILYIIMCIVSFILNSSAHARRKLLL